MIVHFIAIGGAVMHNLAIALHKKGHQVTGSDDEIFNPAKSNLLKYNLLPKNIGWDIENINSSMDAVILGMHAREDNPELIRAQELGLKIYSFPEFMYEQTKNKKRIVIGGSHGKTTITSIIMHVLKNTNIDFDYLVGSQIEGFDTMVDLGSESDFAVFEGDEYLTSALDLRPKFHVYKPNIALISGIAWDHINVFPTFENYVKQFEIFINCIEAGGCLIYYEKDKNILKLVKNRRKDISYIPYSIHPFENCDNQSFLINDLNKIPIRLIGDHNIENIQGAKLILNEMGIDDNQFYTAISIFKGAAKRLQLINNNDTVNVYLDFAHSPSKLKATVNAVKNQFVSRKLVACMELHTFSSLTNEFLKEYKGAMSSADVAIVFYNPETIEHKKLPPVSIDQVKEAFNQDNLKVFTTVEELRFYLLELQWKEANLLLMSSGNFSGLDVNELCENILS